MVKQAADDECAPLTFKLAGILWARGHGLDYAEIGEIYGYTAGTVREYLRQARLLLGAATADEAIAEAARLGIIDLSGPGPTKSAWAGGDDYL